MSLIMINWRVRIILLVTMTLKTLSLCAQEIQWSEKYEMSSIFNENKILKTTKDGFYVLQNYKDANYDYQRKLSFYDWNFKKSEGAKSIDLSYKNTKGYHPLSLSMKENHYLFYTTDDVDRQVETLLLSPFNFETLTINNPPHVVGEVAYQDLINPQEGLSYCTSADQSKILFYGVMAYPKKGNGKIGTLLINDDCEELSAKNILLKQKAEILTTDDIVDAVVDNMGNAYLLCKIYKGKDKKEERKIGTRFIYSLIYVGIKADPQVLDTLKVLSPQDSAIVVSAKLSMNATTGVVTCLGTYKIPRKKAGLFSLNLTADLSEKPVVIDYPKELLDVEAKMPRKIKKRKHLSSKNYKVKSIFEQKDGTQIVIAEQHYINAYWDKSEGRQELHKLHNLLVTKIAGNRMEWSKVLAKRQRGGGVGYTNVPETLYSFYAFEKEGDLHILYNELKENLKIINEYQLEKGYYNKPKDCLLVHCKIDLGSGVLKFKEPVLDLKKDGVAVYPKATKVLEDGNLLLLAVKPEYSLKEPSYIRFGHWKLN